MISAYNWDEQNPDKRPVDPKKKGPIALTPSKTFLIKQIDAFAASFPNAPETISSLYLAAEIKLNYGHLDDARKRFEYIIKAVPDREEGEAALHNLLNAFVQSKKWPALISVCNGFLENQKVMAAGHRQILTETLNYAEDQNKRQQKKPAKATKKAR